MDQPEAVPAIPRSPRAWTMLAWGFRLVVYLAIATAFAYGGPVLRIAAGLGLVFSLWADIEGAARHILRLALATGAIVALPWVTPKMSSLVAGQLGGSAMSPWNLVGGFVASMLLITLAGAIVGWVGRRFSRWINRVAPLAQANRAIGSLLGACEGGLVVAAAIWAIGLVDAPLSAFASTNEERPAVIDTLLTVRDAIANDPAGRYIQQMNPLPDIPMLGTIQNMAEVASNPEAMAEFIDGPAMRSVLESPALQRHLERFRNDPKLRKAVEERDFAAITSSPAFAELMSDQAVFTALTERWEDLRKELAARKTAAMP
ncbi:MAG: CvpA family protein [Phycisphaerales bacterium]|nr:CvpA family protein [Phycisphaerales bacterium]